MRASGMDGAGADDSDVGSAPFPAIQPVVAEAPERTFRGGHRMAGVDGEPPFASLRQTTACRQR